MDYNKHQEGSSERATEELTAFLQDADVGTAKFAAFSDFIDLRDAEIKLYAKRGDLGKAIGASRLEGKSRQMGIQDAESYLRVAEGEVVTLRTNVHRDFSRVPGYQQAYERTEKLSARVKEAFQREPVLSNRLQYGSAKLDKHLHELRSNIYTRPQRQGQPGRPA